MSFTPNSKVARSFNLFVDKNKTNILKDKDDNSVALRKLHEDNVDNKIRVKNNLLQNKFNLLNYTLECFTLLQRSQKSQLCAS